MITVTFYDAPPTLAAVAIHPSLLARLVLGRRARYLVATSVPDRGGGRCWIRDDSSLRIDDPRIVQALNAALRSQRHRGVGQ